MAIQASIFSMQSNVGLKSVSLSSKTCQALTFGDASVLRSIRRWYLSPPLHKRVASSATAGRHTDMDIVDVKRCMDGSQLFTFGAKEESSPKRAKEESPPKRAFRAASKAEPTPRTRTSGYKKRSTVPKRAPRKDVPSSKPSEEPPPEPALPPRPPSSFAKRSPIPHSSARAPAARDSLVPVAVSPRVTPASDGKSSPSENAKLTGVRERSEAAIPTQGRLRSKGGYKRSSPVRLAQSQTKSKKAGGRRSRLAAPTESSEDGKPSSDGLPARTHSSYSKKSPLAKKSSSRQAGSVIQEAEARKPAASSLKPERPPSSFKRRALVVGHSPRKRANVDANETAMKEDANRPKRLASAFKRSSPRTSTGPKTARQPGARAAPKAAAEAVMNGVAQAAGRVENAVNDVVSAVTGGLDQQDDTASGDLDLQGMKLAELREVAKERKVKGMWTMKKAELIEALQISFSEDV